MFSSWSSWQQLWSHPIRFSYLWRSLRLHREILLQFLFWCLDQKPFTETSKILAFFMVISCRNFIDGRHWQPHNNWAADGGWSIYWPLLIEIPNKVEFLDNSSWIINFQVCLFHPVGGESSLDWRLLHHEQSQHLLILCMDWRPSGTPTRKMEPWLWSLC